MMDRSEQLKNDLDNILSKWKVALEKPETELTRDAAILRFELAFEVGWKLLQVLERDEGYEVKSPRQAFQQAFALGWITDEVIWADILRARNTAIHVYREAFAQSLYDELQKFYEAFKDLQKALEQLR